MSEVRLRQFSGIASIFGGLLIGFLGVAWAITHGSTEINRKGVWLGIDNLTVSQMNIIYSVMIIIAILGIRHVAASANKKGKTGYSIAVIGLILQAISQILQNHILNPLLYWESTIITVGFLLFKVSWLLFVIGMISLGTTIRTKDLFMNALIIAFGLMMVFSFAIEFIVLPALGNGTRMWDIVLALKNVPFALCWIILGVKLLSSTRNIPIEVKRQFLL